MYISLAFSVFLSLALLISHTSAHFHHRLLSLHRQPCLVLVHHLGFSPLPPPVYYRQAEAARDDALTAAADARADLEAAQLEAQLAAEERALAAEEEQQVRARVLA